MTKNLAQMFAIGITRWIFEFGTSPTAFWGLLLDRFGRMFAGVS